MFRYAKNREVLWPVIIKQPSDDGAGRVDEIQVNILFRLLGRQEYIDKQQEALDELLLEHVTGWELIADGAGDDLPYNQENLRALIDIPYVRTALFEGLMNASTGAPVKNSSAGSGG